MLQNLRLLPRLILTFMVLVAGTVVVAAVGILGVREVNDRLREIYELRVRSISSLYEIQLAQNNATLGERALLDPYVQSDPAARRAESDRIEAALIVFEESANTYEAQPKDSAEEKIWREIRSSIDQWNQGHHKLVELVGDRLEVQRKVQAGKESASTLALNGQQLTSQQKRIAELWVHSDRGLTQALDLNVKAIGELFQHSQKSASAMLTVQVALSLGVVGLTLLLNVLIARSITRPLARATELASSLVATGDTSSRLGSKCRDEVGDLSRAIDALMDQLEAKGREAEAIARGDLTIEVTTASERDRLGGAFRTMLLELRKLVTAIRGGFAQVVDRAQEISGASDALSQGATEQAASLQEISSSTTEIGSRAASSAQNAGRANTLVSGSRGSAERGAREMKAMVEAMGEISRSSQQVGKIIKVIDDIAFQTNLLALNAAVEAARVGKHGKGFAVVAEEVRSLAGRSAKAARETAEMLESSSKNVENGLAVAQRSAEVFGQITQSVATTAGLVEEISAASADQARGISEISKGLGQIDGVTQRNAASAEQTASAARELTASATEVRVLLLRFKLDGLDDPAGEEPRPAPGSWQGAGAGYAAGAPQG